jgi:hypothetical protein
MVVSKPNDCWSVDFKGQFRTGDGKYLYPLTVTDNHSRYLLACQGLQGTLLEPTKAVLSRVFTEHRLPLRLRSIRAERLWLGAGQGTPQGQESRGHRCLARGRHARGGGAVGSPEVRRAIVGLPAPGPAS